jgi:hypothetical protein
MYAIAKASPNLVLKTQPRFRPVSLSLSMNIANFFLAKMSATATDYLLALATSDDATINRNDPISSVVPHKVAKASSHA